MKSSQTENNPQLDTQFLWVLLFFLILLVFLGRAFFRHAGIFPQQAVYLISIAGSAFLFFLYAMWKLNQRNGWVSLWAQHPLWVLLTLLTFPLAITLFWNFPSIRTQLPPELVQPYAGFQLPHFLLIYGWQSLILGIAFIAHPQRQRVFTAVHAPTFLIGTALGLGSWSLVMFLNEIIFQFLPLALPYQNPAPIFWPVLPLALLWLPLCAGFFYFFNLPHALQELPCPWRQFLIAAVFSLLSFRGITLIPAWLFALSISLYREKKGSLSGAILAYSVFNLCMLLLNWQWIL